MQNLTVCSPCTAVSSHLIFHSKVCSQHCSLSPSSTQWEHEGVSRCGPGTPVMLLIRVQCSTLFHFIWTRLQFFIWLWTSCHYLHLPSKVWQPSITCDKHTAAVCPITHTHLHTVCVSTSWCSKNHILILNSVWMSISTTTIWPWLRAFNTGCDIINSDDGLHSKYEWTWTAGSSAHYKQISSCSSDVCWRSNQWILRGTAAFTHGQRVCATSTIVTDEFTDFVLLHESKLQ